MGGGDLNMKKSWHPGLIKNRAQVWEDQNAALKERKRIEALKKEIEEERAANELQRLNEANGGPKRQERVEFLYAGAGSGSGIADDREAYLLGRKRIDDVLGQDNLGQSTGTKNPAADPGAINMRDVSNKVALDPLLAIKRQEAAQYKAAIDRKKAEMEAEARKNARRALKRSRPEDNHHRRSSRRDDHDGRYGRRSPSRDRHYDSRRSGRSDRHSRRDRSEERDSRSSRQSPPRRRSPSRSSENATEYRNSRTDDHYSSHHSRRRARSRSRSAQRSSRRAEQPHQTQDSSRVKSQSAEERLAAMTESAKDLDDMRTRRLEESRAKEAAERMKEEAGRARHSTTTANFIREIRLSDTMVR